MSGKSKGKNGDSSKKPRESANEPAEAEDHSAADGPVGDSAPGAGHHPSDDAAAAEEGEAVAAAVSEPDAPPEGGGAPADAPTEDQEKPAAEAEPEPEPEPKAEPAAPEQETLHGQPLVDSFGQAVVHCDRAAYLELCQALRADGYDMIIGVCGVDYLVHPGRSLPEGVTPERFEVVVELAAVATRRRIRVRCQVPADEPSVPSLFDVWPGTEAHERETYDMYGIVFEGHPDPSRILMPEDWEGHPLRKDYATGRIPVQFKETPGGR